MFLMRKLSWGLIFCAVLMVVLPAQAATLYSESASGDLSGNRFAPTSRTTIVGDNDLFVTTSGGDQDYLTVVVPAGQRLSNLRLKAFQASSFDQTSFLGMASGTTFPEDPNLASGAQMLGYTHLNSFLLNQDLFPSMHAFGTLGFTTPLPAGNYTFWMQQLGTSVTYQLDFVTTAVPEPAGLGLLACAAFLARRRPSHRRV